MILIFKVPMGITIGARKYNFFYKLITSAYKHKKICLFWIAIFFVELAKGRFNNKVVTQCEGK